MARAIGINHVALEVDDVAAALEWYGRFLDFELRGQRPAMAWIDPGDPVLALSSPRTQGEGGGRHFGLVGGGKGGMRAGLREARGGGAPSGGLRFDDPWGN